MLIARRTPARSTIGRVASLALVAGLTVGLQITTPPAFAADAVAGAQTAGASLFPNQGNGGYDAKHYDIDFRVDVGISATSGGASTTNLPHATATIDAVTTGAPLSSYSFDFQGTSTTLAASTLNVDSVTVNGAPASFTRIENTTIPDASTDKHKLVVTPATPVDGAFTTVVTYSGQPVVHRDTDNSIEGWNQTVDGATFVNQPVGSMTLFPNNNTPRDKATYRFTINAPTTLTTSNLAQAGGKPYQAGVVSNGELTSRTASADGTRTTWVWNQAKPMASELTLVSVGRYDIYTSDITLASGRTIPEWTFIDPALSVANKTASLSSRAQLKSLLDFYETKYGPYPGNSTGVVVDNTTGISYYLETQDRPFFPNSVPRGTMYHEVMHQWWGDNVAPTDWNDLVLNEGPAQYSEYQFPYEGAGTSTTTTEQQNFDLYNARTATSATFAVAPAAMTDAGDLFGEQVYEKGSISLEALRTSIGAADFETLMREYQLTYGGGQITGRRTAAFEAMAESISGRDLTAFFQTWWYTSGKPAWPVKFDLNVTRPSMQNNPGDQFIYTVTARNTGKVAMPAGTVVTVDLADVLDDASIGTLPATTTLDGTTLTWTVPATALAATANIRFVITLKAGTTGATIKPVVRATTLGSTCLDCAPSFTVGAAPIDPAPVPTIAGSDPPMVGTPLTAVPGDWAAGTTLAYQWFIDGSPVPGATSATYMPTVDAVGFVITVKVTGTLAGFNPTSQTSAVTSLAFRGVQPVATPTISGTPKVGSRLTVDPGTWLPGTVFTYQWRANGTNISGATGPVYTPAAASQVGQTIDVLVSGTKSGYANVGRTSATTTAVTAGDPLVATPIPTLPATAKVGTVLTAAPGYWDDGVTLTYTWQLDGTNISGATAATYTPIAAQVGKNLTITVVGTKPGVTAVSRVSAPVTVDLGTQVRQPTPTLGAEPHAGVSVNGTPGTWDTGTTLSYRWLVDGVFQAGATTIAYSPTVDQIGKALTFEVTSTRTGYTTVVATSLPVAIGLQVQNFKPTPTVAGSGKVGTDLTATPGTWDTGTTQTYQWSVAGIPVDGATALTYPVAPADLGQPVTITVTSTKPTYETITRSSAPVTATAGDLTLTPDPTITGTPKVGVALTAVPGAWDDGTTFTYQWLTDGTPVAGATAATYTPGPGRLGTIVTVAVTGTKTGYAPVTRTSGPTAPVATGDQVATPTPTITGTPKVGVALTAVPGTWDDGVTLTYQWSVDGTPVAGATEASYTPTAGQAGLTATVAVTGTTPGYADVTRTSAATEAIALGSLAVAVPTITGTPQVGVALTAAPGDWEDGVTLDYQWLIGTDPIAGATGASYTPTAAQVGDLLTVRVTGTKPGYETAVVFRDAGSVVVLGDQASTPTPTITGSAQVAVQLTGVPGTWDEATALAYQWFTDGTPVAGATGLTYTPGADQVGSVVTFAVTGTKTGYAAVTRTSEPTAAVALGDLVATPTPTITGTAKVAVALTVVPGTWDDGVELAYQWFVDGVPVAGATGTSYTPTAGQVGAVVLVTVLGTRTGYTSVVEGSDPTAAIVRGDQVATPTPTITGTPQVGLELTGVPGTWDDGTALTYQWFTGGTAVAGATGLTYTPGAGQAGDVVTFAVTATVAGYEPATRTSAPTAAVAVGVQVATPTPTITGVARVGVQLTGVPGTWDDGTALTYQWFTGATPVDGATGLSYTPGPGKVGETVTFEVTATKAGYTTVSRFSAPTAAVALGDQSATPVPTVAGVAKVGVQLTATPGTWDDGTDLTYQWLVGGTAVAGATGLTYTPTPGTVGAVVTFAVTGTRAGYTTVTKVSTPTAAIVRGSQSVTPVPTITGTAQVAVPLTAQPGTWDDGVTFGYQWLVAGTAVAGATGTSYTPTAAQAGLKVMVAVTGTKVGYDDVTTTSVATDSIALGDQVATPTPTITGTPKVGVALTVVPGTWDDGVTLDYRWFVGGTAVAGATGASYTPTGGVGSVVVVRVTATKDGYAPQVLGSDPTAPIAVGDLSSATPRISGPVKVGAKVTALPGTWTPGTTFGYQWLRSGKVIAGATGASYTPVAADQGTNLTVSVRGSKPDYTTVTEVSAATKVALGTMTKSPKPKVIGTLKVGKVLRAVPGARDAGATVSYAWFAGTKAIAGATKATYKLKAGQQGKKVWVKVTFTKAGYTTLSAASAKKGPVKAK